MQFQYKQKITLCVSLDTLPVYLCIQSLSCLIYGHKLLKFEVQKEKTCMILGTGIDCIKNRKDYQVACKPPLKLELASEFQIVVLLNYGHCNPHALEYFTCTGADIPRGIGWTLGL